MLRLRIRAVLSVIEVHVNKRSLLATVLAGAFAGLLLIRDGSAARKKTFAYGPFLAAGTVVLLLV